MDFFPRSNDRLRKIILYLMFFHAFMKNFFCNLKRKFKFTFNDTTSSPHSYPCFPQLVINHKIGITMLRHVDNVNVLLFELPITDCGGEALKVLAMISLEEECENYKRGFIISNNPKFPLMGIINLLWIPRRESS
jgi:hypothetical protein